MSSEVRQQAEEILDTLLSQLDPEQLRQQVDRPFDEAVKHVEYSVIEHSHAGFAALLQRIVTYLHARATMLKRECTPVEAYVEGIAMLDRHYPSTIGSLGGADLTDSKPKGSDAALVDFLRVRDGIVDMIVAVIGHELKRLERRCYVRGVFALHLPSDWDTKCRIVEVFVEKFGKVLPADLVECPSSRCADMIEDLIIGVMNAASPLESIVQKFGESAEAGELLNLSSSVFG